MGKRRINIEKICDKQKRHVAFSKRRKGLFKKAQELSSLTGATIGIICFSEAGNAFTCCYPPPAGDQNGDDGHQRLLSIMQQYYASSNGCTISMDNSQPAPVGEPKSIGSPQLQSMHEREVPLLDSVLAQPVEEGMVESSNFHTVSTNNCCSSPLSPPLSPSIEALLSSQSSSLSWNNNLDFLEMDVEEGAITPSPFSSL